ncbi:MAG: hypothetical protein AAGA76_05320 [Pseudomonadota bacterium]
MRIHYILPFTVALLAAGCQSTKTGGLVSAGNEVNSDATEQTASIDKGEAGSPSLETTASINPGTDENKTLNKNAIATYAAPQPGTVFTWRNNWANLPEIISYKVAGTRNHDSHFGKNI